MDPSNPSNFYPTGFDPSLLPPTPATAFPYTVDTTLQPSFHTYTDQPTPLAYQTPPYTVPTRYSQPDTLYPGLANQSGSDINQQLARLLAVKQEELGQAAMTDNMEATSSRITPIQHPQVSSALSTHANVSRIPLSPPLVIQMDCWTSIDTLDIPHDELPFLVCHLSLETADGQDAMMVHSGEGDMQQNLYGTLVATPAVLVNQDGATGTYFCFPDVSVRLEGTYRLRCTLFRITGGGALDTVYTNPFAMVNNREYRAPAVTPLTQHFHNQGVINFGLPKDEW